MKMETTYVPKDKCPLDFIAELGAQTAISWLFLHKNAIEKLCKTADSFSGHIGRRRLTWEATEKYPRTVLEYDDSGVAGYTWFNILYIEASDIAFRRSPSTPAYLFFLEMEE